MLYEALVGYEVKSWCEMRVEQRSDIATCVVMHMFTDVHTGFCTQHLSCSSSFSGLFYITVYFENCI